MCVCVCVRERERERDTHTERQRERDRERDRERQRELTYVEFFFPVFLRMALIFTYFLAGNGTKGLKIMN